jgi:ketosteroid isomerase-like protein
MAEQSIEARLDALESHRAIERLVFDYAHAFDNKDVELLKTIWHDDANFDLGPAFGMFTGPDDIVNGANGLWEAIWPQHHWMANTRIDIDGDTATGVVALDCFATSVEAGPSMIGGTYYDRYERRDGVWKIVDRRFEMAYFTPMQGWKPAMGSEAEAATA